MIQWQKDSIVYMQYFHKKWGNKIYRGNFCLRPDSKAVAEGLGRHILLGLGTFVTLYQTRNADKK
jgi:hypothetical protein